MKGMCHESQSHPYLWNCSQHCQRKVQAVCRNSACCCYAAGRSPELSVGLHKTKIPNPFLQSTCGWHTRRLRLAQPQAARRHTAYKPTQRLPALAKGSPPVPPPNRVSFNLSCKLNALFGVKGALGRQKAAVLEWISARTGFQQC